MAKKAKTPETPFTIFLNPRIVKQLENGPKITAVGQVIVYKTKEGKYDTDVVEIVDTEEIEFMGVKITEHKAQSETIKHFKAIVVCVQWGERKFSPLLGIQSSLTYI